MTEETGKHATVRVYLDRRLTSFRYVLAGLVEFILLRRASSSQQRLRSA